MLGTNLNAKSKSSLVNSKYSQWAPGTIHNLISLEPSSSLIYCPIVGLKAGPGISHYSGHVVDDILDEIFAERRGHFPETSSMCKDPKEVETDAEKHMDKRLKYWRNVLNKRQEIQLRLQAATGRQPEDMLHNRRATLDHRNKQTVKRVLDYAERMLPPKLAARERIWLTTVVDPCTCAYAEGVCETLPQAGQDGFKTVEITGLPSVIQKELLGAEASPEEREHSWLKSRVLEHHIDNRFDAICEVIEHFPKLDGLEVTGTNVEKLRPKRDTELLGEQIILQVSSSNIEVCSFETCENLDEVQLDDEEEEAEPEIPEIALSINGKNYIPCDTALTECCELLTPFKCDPFQRRRKTVLQLKNIGRQTLSFSWQQGVYFYNRATLLLAMDDEFLFDTDSFRLIPGEEHKVVVMYQPRKVGMAVELWRLQIMPRIFCGNNESIQLRFHGRCTPPKEYMERLRELHCAVICKSNTETMQDILHLQAGLVPLIEPPPACCPYERHLDEREVFNSLNPGYNCTRFDDLELFKEFYKAIKKPREPQWDLRLESIKALIMRIEYIPDRKEIFEKFMILLSPLLGAPRGLECTTLGDVQKERTRFIYVRGVICNGIEEWEDMMFVLEESFYKSELQHYFIKQMADGEEGEEDDEGYGDRIRKPPLAEIKLPIRTQSSEEGVPLDEVIHASVLRSLKHSKYFRDTLYVQTYSHLCTIAENIVSVIESTTDVPN